ncbi:hypothetical protein TWF703_003177 [Orbilia oligospora]|uniref:EGF-like domain-containing protein n=1 Tax=Orbilia oligospora TaxID=2813651 RepID=A0A7C8JUB9_ORBOL|nr:hypothetical protein TWF703_003177 [Orbilia oligospora]
MLGDSISKTIVALCVLSISSSTVLAYPYKDSTGLRYNLRKRGPELCPARYQAGLVPFFAFPQSVFVAITTTAPTTTASRTPTTTSSVSSSAQTTTTTGPATTPSTTAITTTRTTTSSTTTPFQVVCPSSPPSCEANGCSGTVVGGTAACRSTNLAQCSCIPSVNTPGYTCPNQSCSANNCNGSFDNNGAGSTCKNYGAGCSCTPTTAMCGTTQSCDAGGCAGTFDSGTVATCKANWATCRCDPTPNTCGTPRDCDANGCAGTFDPNGVATCKANYATCRCNPTSANCGNAASCDAGGCAGSFDSNGIATCKGAYATCPCNPTPNTCGNPQTCDTDGCAGSFNSDGRATCKGSFAGLGNVPYPRCTNAYAGCNCNPTDNTCGTPRSCGDNGCNGAWDGNTVAALAETAQVVILIIAPVALPALVMSHTRGVPTLMRAVTATQRIIHVAPRGVVETTGAMGSGGTCGNRAGCDSNNCAGSFAGLGNVPYPRCTNAYAGCNCNPTDNTCGTPRSCGDNGCNGAWDGDSGIARCTGNFIGCRCNPTSATCGARASCFSGGCAGRRGGDGVWRCTQKYAPCGCYYNSFWGFLDRDAGYTGGRYELRSNDNECTNLPSNWNDVASSISVISWVVNCQFYENINCGGLSIYGTSQRNAGNNPWDLQGANSYFNDKISSYKCWLDPLTWCGDTPCHG